MPAHPALVDRDDLVLVVIDVQERLSAVMEARERIVERSVQLVRTAALLGVPVIVTRQYPKGLGDTEPALAAAIESAESQGANVQRVDKTAFCACREPAFEEALVFTGRTQVAIAGMETHICIAQTALTLLANGYRVQVVADACCSRNAHDHAIALDRMRAEGVVVTVSESVQYEAVGEAGTPEFRSLLAIVKGE